MRTAHVTVYHTYDAKGFTPLIIFSPLIIIFIMCYSGHFSPGTPFRLRGTQGEHVN